jgi:hypothetical protein
VVDERRMFQRLYLTRPLKARFGRKNVTLIDVSATGALIEDGGEIPVGQQKTLHFTWRDEKVTIRAETVRAETGRAGLRFLEESEQLRRLIAASATEVLRAQQANVDGNRERNVVGEETLTSVSAALSAGVGFTTYTFENGVWTKRRALLPDQPENGFTIQAGEPDDQVAMLCQTYERGNPDSRRLTRLLAELSVAGIKR